MVDSAQDAIIVLPDKIELSGSQAKAFLDALKSLDLYRDEIKVLREENIALKERLNDLEMSTAIRIAEDRQRIAFLEREELQPAQQNRADVLRALLAANGGKMLAKDARHKMGLKKATFSVLLKAMKDDIEKRPYHLNKSSLVLVLK